MYHEIIAQHHFLTLWERFVNGLTSEHFGDYLAFRLPETSSGTGFSDSSDQRTIWAMEHLHRCGWRARVPGQSLDVMLPEPFVVDPFGHLHPLTHTIFIGTRGYPDLPGIPFPAALLFELLSCPRPSSTSEEAEAAESDPSSAGT